jgi:hypothetical protein
MTIQKLKEISTMKELTNRLNWNT